MNKKIRGFSLVELLIVVTVLGIIAAIAIPNIMASRRAANEGSAVAALRTLHGAQSVYFTSIGSGTFAGTVSSTGDTTGLGLLNSAALIDSSLASGTKSGYNFVGATSLPTTITTATFFFSANPVSSSGISQSGTRRYNTDTVGMLRYDTTSLATAYDATTVTTGTGL